MKLNGKTIELPPYHGRKWINATLPEKGELWTLGKHKSIRKDRSSRGAVAEELHRLIQEQPWRWPEKTVYFFADLHADTDAFIASLVASGGIKKTGPQDKDFRLTRAGRKARFLIGGDCFDKGPSNLRLLRMIRLLMDSDADVRILAGNHDVRMLLGIRSLDLPPDPRTDHFFVRMGPKALPFLKEISDQYLLWDNARRDTPSTSECRRRLFPTKRWFRDFPRHAGWGLHEDGLEREMQRLQKKLADFEDNCIRTDLSLRMVYAATRKWQELFLDPHGEFYWFFKRMKVARREGSFLFLHAGLDDRIARMVGDEGVKQLNRRFREKLDRDMFDFYYGPMANTIRTKYRTFDMPLTRQGVRMIHARGIHALVHGHLNLLHGQRMMLRKGILNFECDATMDRNTRKREGLKGPGAGVTIFHRDGMVMGISTDYPRIKVFEPKSLIQQYTGARHSGRRPDS